jgi:hypothetical protein
VNNSLPYPALIKYLVSHYYQDDNPTVDQSISSHWKHYSQQFKLQTDAHGRIRVLVGMGFGTCQWHSPIQRLLDQLCIITHLSQLPNRADIQRLWPVAIKICRAMGLDPTLDVFRYVCTLTLLEKHVPTPLGAAPIRALMIGDGYGVLAALLKARFPEARLILVDIGKTLLFQAYYCQLAHPQAQHMIIGKNAGEEESDFLYCPAERISELGERPFNLAVNIASMQEMTPDIVANYFTFMRHHFPVRNIFYCCNRERKILMGGEVLEFTKYAWRETDRNLIDELCPWHQYYFSARPTARGLALLGLRLPLVNYYDGPMLHRLSILDTA